MRRSDARVVEIYVRRKSSHGTGTGYLLARGVVLTAAHVLRDKTGQVVVRHLGDRTDWRCTVLWQDEGVDAALLRIVDPAWAEPSDLPPVTWGRLATDRTEVRFALSAFPSGMAARHDDNTLVLRDTAHGGGSLDARADAEGFLHATLDQPIPPSLKDRLRWKGASGAAVLVSGCVIGLVTWEADTDGRRLLVVPITTLVAHAGFRDYVGLIAFTPAELRPVLAADGPRRAYSPVSLLSADAEVVRFHGRDQLVDELTSWCAESTRFSVRLISGQGGHGKTRLARHLVALAREREWSAGLLADHIDGSRLAVLGEVTTPLLLVVDYAEDRVPQLVELEEVLRKALSGRRHAQIRLLLLARAEGEWWGRLRAEAPLLRSFSARTVIPLPPLEPTAAMRSAALGDAVADLAARLGEVAGYTGFDPAALPALELPSVSADRFGCALNLQMTALIALLQAIDPVEVGKDEDDEAILLRHEQKFWKRTAAGYGLGGLDLTARRQLVGAATLCQADNQDEAYAVLDGLDVAAESRDQTARWLSSLYPADNAYWGPLIPDRVGEYLISSVTDDHEDLLTCLLPNASRPQALRALRTLARADVHRPGTAAKLHRLINGHADPLAFTAVEAATTVEHPEPLRRALATVARGNDFRLLSRLYDATPLQSQALEQWATALAERLTRAARSAFGSEPSPQRQSELARRLNNNAIRLAASGRHTDALRSSTESVALRRELAETGAPADLHDLALSLNTQVNALSDTGNLLEALQAAEELVVLCQATVEFDPADLPMALYSLAVRHDNLGNHTDAVKAAEETLRHYRELANDDPAAYRPDVALAFSQLSISASQAGLHDDSVDAASGALDIYRELADELPDAHAADVARALTNLAAALRAVGRRDDAIAAAAESVRLHRRIMQDVPETDPAWLSDALTTHGECLSDVDEHEEALAAHSEVVAINRLLHESGQGADPARFAQALHNKALALYTVERVAAAVPVAEQALAFYRPLAASLPLAHGPLLSATLNLIATCLLELDHPERALAAADESVSVCRRLVEDEHDAYSEPLVNALLLRTDTLRATGQPSDALNSLDEAVVLQRHLVDLEPDALPSLEDVLGDFVDLLAENGHRARAVSAAEEHVSVARRTAQFDEGQATIALGRALNRYAIMLSDADENAVMLPAVEEALDLWRGLVEHEPDRFRRDLSTALHLLAVCRVQKGQLDEALDAASKNAELLEECAQTDPDTYLPMLLPARVDQATILVEAGQPVAALNAADSVLTAGGDFAELTSDIAAANQERARALSMMNLHDEALAAADAGLRALQELPDADPVLHSPYLASMLCTRAELFAAAGEPTMALAAAEASIRLYSRLVSDHPGFFGAGLKKALNVQHEVLNEH